VNDMYFDDFHVGQSFTSRPQVVTRERIIAYAEEFDPQPQHISEEAAAKSNFRELIASGWHTASVSMRLQYEAVFNRIANGGMGAEIEKLTWIRPVRPGDELDVVVEVQDMRVSKSRPERGIMTFLTTTLNQKDEPVETMRGVVLVPRRPQS
jgi:acyl dehydratase